MTELQKGGELRRALLERGACLVLDLQCVVYVWKGKGATLDARNVGMQVPAHVLASGQTGKCDSWVGACVCQLYLGACCCLFACVQMYTQSFL